MPKVTLLEGPSSRDFPDAVCRVQQYIRGGRAMRKRAIPMRCVRNDGKYLTGATLRRVFVEYPVTREPPVDIRRANSVDNIIDVWFIGEHSLCGRIFCSMCNTSDSSQNFRNWGNVSGSYLNLPLWATRSALWCCLFVIESYCSGIQERPAFQLTRNVRTDKELEHNHCKRPRSFMKLQT